MVDPEPSRSVYTNGGAPVSVQNTMVDPEPKIIDVSPEPGGPQGLITRTKKGALAISYRVVLAYVIQQ